MKRIGITIGDVNGIGPEVALKAICGDRRPAGVSFALVGPEANWREQIERFGAELANRDVEILPAGEPVAWRPGEICADASRVALAAVDRAVDGCLSGAFDAMVTAPICKEGLHLAGIRVPGHTEYLAGRTGAERFGMMLVGGGLRVMLVTRHLPIAEVPPALSEGNVLEAIELAAEALPAFGLAAGTIGVCGLNPHAGDGGVLGREEIEIIAPAIRAAREKGLRVSGPVPADVVFHRALAGDFSAVVAMYHDQGLGPLKTIAFDEGVNVTLGLPVVRTSPDHGTAFGIAGKGIASARSMENAVALAAKMAGAPAEGER